MRASGRLRRRSPTECMCIVRAVMRRLAALLSGVGRILPPSGRPPHRVARDYTSRFPSRPVPRWRGLRRVSCARRAHGSPTVELGQARARDASAGLDLPGGVALPAARHRAGRARRARNFVGSCRGLARRPRRSRAGWGRGRAPPGSRVSPRDQSGPRRCDRRSWSRPAAAADDSSTAPERARPSRSRRSSASWPRTCSPATPATGAQMLARQRAAGVRLIRQTFHWDRIERQPGRYDFREYDAYMAAIAAPALQILPILFTPPRSGAADGRRAGTYPPDDRRTWGRFAAPRWPLRPRGQFWRPTPICRATRFGPGRSGTSRTCRSTGRADPTRASTWISLEARASDKRADPRAAVVSAGLSESSRGMPFEDFVSGMFEAGADESLDVFALHASRATRRVSGRGGDPAVAAHGAAFESADLGHRDRLGERRPASPFTLRRAGQAERSPGSARRALHVAATSSACSGVVYFNWRDAPVYEGGQDFFGFHTGLVDAEGNPKPAFDAYRSVASPGRRQGRPGPPYPGHVRTSVARAEYNSLRTPRFVVPVRLARLRDRPHRRSRPGARRQRKAREPRLHRRHLRGRLRG